MPQQRRSGCGTVIPGDDPSHPWWTRSAYDAFVLGRVGDGVEEVTVQRIDLNRQPTADAPITASVVAAGGPQGGLYVAVLPIDWCWVLIAASDGRVDPQLGPIRPLPGDPNHADCLGAG